MPFNLEYLTWGWAIIALFATLRITSALHNEQILSWFREEIIGTRESSVSDITGIHNWFVYYPDTFIGDIFSCFWCLSFWVSLVVILIWFLFPYVLLPFALSGAAILIYSHL